MPITNIVILFLLALLIFWVIAVYNKMIRYIEAIKNNERQIEIQASAWDHIYFFDNLVAELHHGALAVRLVQSIHGQLEGFHFVCVYSHDSWF